MGTELRLSAWTQDNAAAQKAFDAVLAEFARLEGLMSVWREGSDVQRINEAAGRGPVDVSPETIELLLLARQVSDWTGGKFDVTFAALSPFWRFDHDQDNRVPPASDIAAALSLIDYRQLEVNVPARTVFLRRDGMRIHLGGIGKGYAVDRGAAILRRHGIANFMIQSGGDLYVAGRRGDRPWQIAIQDPRGAPDRVIAALALSDLTVSTSGDYERAFVQDGVRYHHLLDPDSGQPARGCRSVSIVAASAVVADGLATGVFVMGPEQGLALIERLPGVEGVIVTAGNEVLVSSGLEDEISLLAPPSDGP
jgi:thiamine biosynthesis lipoprotein